jgi:hypothetical protein
MATPHPFHADRSLIGIKKKKYICHQNQLISGRQNKSTREAIFLKVKAWLISGHAIDS